MKRILLIDLENIGIPKGDSIASLFKTFDEVHLVAFNLNLKIDLLSVSDLLPYIQQKRFFIFKTCSGVANSADIALAYLAGYFQSLDQKNLIYILSRDQIFKNVICVSKSLKQQVSCYPNYEAAISAATASINSMQKNTPNTKPNT